MGVIRTRQGFRFCNYLDQAQTEKNFAKQIAEGLIGRALEATEKANVELESSLGAIRSVIAAL